MSLVIDRLSHIPDFINTIGTRLTLDEFLQEESEADLGTFKLSGST